MGIKEFAEDVRERLTGKIDGVSEKAFVVSTPLYKRFASGAEI